MRTDTLFHQTCLGKQFLKTPIWIMRQAGRYLPEYKEVRKKFPNFMDFCFTPDAVCKVTLQPIQRFDFDAAIIFSDILVIPHVLGQYVNFIEGYGPSLEPFQERFLKKENMDWDKMKPIYEGISKTRNALSVEKSLIGFCGTPWTLAAYMIHLKKIGDGAALQEKIESFGHTVALIDCLTDIVATHAINQINAGCDIIQLFDSWAGLCAKDKHDDFLLTPLKNILKKIWHIHPHTPIIYYGRHVSQLYKDLKDIRGPLVLGVDQDTSIESVLVHQKPVQGNLDPEILIQGGDDLNKGVLSILNQTKNIPHIFNLGHGITPQTPIAHVEQMLKYIRTF